MSAQQTTLHCLSIYHHHRTTPCSSKYSYVSYCDSTCLIRVSFEVPFLLFTFRMSQSQTAMAQNPDSEILKKIFLLVHAHDVYSKILQRCGSHNVSQVCRSWRTAAISCPDLWATLHIILTDGMTTPRVIPAIESWLKRSRDTEILVWIEYKTSGDAITASELLIGAFDALAQCSDRIKLLCLMIPEYHCTAALSFVEKLIKGLQSLSMTLFPSGNWQQPTPPSESNSEALHAVLSQLKRLQVIGKWPLSFSTVKRYPYLTNLDIRAYQAEEVLRTFLEKCPALEVLRCHVYLDFLQASIVTPPPPIRALPSIRLLDYRAAGIFSDNIYRHLDGLRLPNLHELLVDYGDQATSDSGQDWPVLVRFLEASQPPLESFYLMNCLFSAEAITACLQLLPELTDLRCRVSVEVAKALVISGNSSGQPALCPKLKRMILNTPVMSIPEAESMAAVLEEMVRSRCTSPTRSSGSSVLRYLKLPDEFIDQTRFTNRIKDCISLGLSITAFSPDGVAS